LGRRSVEQNLDIAVVDQDGSIVARHRIGDEAVGAAELTSRRTVAEALGNGSQRVLTARGERFIVNLVTPLQFSPTSVIVMEFERVGGESN